MQTSTDHGPVPASAALRAGDEAFSNFTHQLTAKLNGGAKLDELLDFVFDQLSPLIPFDRIGIATVDEAVDKITLKWARSKRTHAFLNRGFTTNLRSTSLGTILTSGNPRIINDLLKYAADHPKSQTTQLAIRDGIRSSLTCPLISRSKNTGIVFFSSYETNTYQSEHIETFDFIAQQLSVLIETERLKSYELLSKTNEKNLAQMIHDIRSPLATIQGYMDFSFSRDWMATIPEEARETFQIVRKNASFLFSLLDDLMQTLQLDGKPLLSIKEVEVNFPLFCDELISAFTGLCATKHIKLVFEPQNLRNTARFDPQKIRRAIDNLMTNAIKYSQRFTTITLAVKGDGETIQFTVSDQGLGIAESEIPKLFHDFGRTSTRPTEQEESTGLGLAIVKRIVDLHQGSVFVKSLLGKGSVFGFTLPQTQTQSQTALH